MNSPSTLDEVCVLISAQLDMLEGPPLTSIQLIEFHARAERIKVLCTEFAPLDGAAQFPTRRLRPLTDFQQAQAEDEGELQFAEAA